MTAAGTLDGKIALVTGGSRGIGKAIAMRLAGAGARVMITYRKAADEAGRVVDAVRQGGGLCIAFQSDSAAFDRSKEIVEEITGQFQRLDILVNNAGITKDALLVRMTEQDWDSVIATNLKGVFNFSRAAARTMMAQRSGKIINISSIVGLAGNAGQTNYAASKAGIIGFTKSLAKELSSRNIQVNAVAPGFVDTDMTAALTDEQRKELAESIPLKRTARPEEIAGVVAFLASADADYITGQVLCIDGGLTM